MSRVTKSVLVLFLAAATARAAPEQLTASAGDSTVQRIGPAATKLVAIQSTGDLTPGAPGNLDASREIYLLNLATRSMHQVSSSLADSSAARITSNGDVVVSSRGDLTPGAPGNLDGGFESWLWLASTTSLVQMTSSVEDSFFQTFWDDGNRAFFVSKGDLTPGAPGNTTGANQVYVYDVATKSLTQLTNAPQQSLIRGICAKERCGIVESAADLVPGGNADHSIELFLLDLDALTFKQITSSTGTTHYRGQDATGRYLAMESTGDLVAGNNADGSQEVFVYDRRKARLVQLTKSAGDSYFDGFVPRSTRVVVDGTQDLVAGKNIDATNEVFTVDFVSRHVVQHTRSAGDSYFAGFANAKSGLVAIESSGDLAGRTTTTGAYQVWLQTLGARRSRARRVTNGAVASSVAGFDASGAFVAIQTKADLVAGGNADGSNEVFVARTRTSPKLRQLTSSAQDSTFGAFAGDGKTLLVNSRGDLSPGGNADGSSEVFRITYR